MNLKKAIQTLTLTFISFQGVMIMIDPIHRNKLYEMIQTVGDVRIPLLQSMVQHARIVVSIALIPTVFYPQSWIIPKFISLMAYVVYIGTIYNLYLFHTYHNLAQFVFQIFVLVEVLFIIVDDLLLLDQKQRKLQKKKSQVMLENINRQRNSIEKIVQFQKQRN